MSRPPVSRATSATRAAPAAKAKAKAKAKGRAKPKATAKGLRGTAMTARVGKGFADAKASSTRQGKRALALLVSSVAAVGILFAFVLPARTYLGQRAAVTSAEERVRVLDAQNARLKTRADALKTDAEVERIAREQYGMARPGEEAYAILPSATEATAAPVAPPAPRPLKHRSAWSRAVNAVSFWK